MPISNRMLDAFSVTGMFHPISTVRSSEPSGSSPSTWGTYGSGSVVPYVTSAMYQWFA